MNIASRREPIVCEQSEMVGQLREENLALRRRLVSPGGLKPDAGGVGAGDGHLRAKLQLIAMGNRLRAQLQASGQDDTEAPCSARAAESLAVERDGRQPDHHLSTLEKLQYQLTTQELQYAQREQPVVMVRAPRSESDSGGQEGQSGAADPWEQGHQDTARRRSMDRPPYLLSQSESSSPSGPLLSSVATEGSLKEVWQTLERGLSPSLLTEGEAELQRLDSPGPGGAAVVPVGPGGSGPQLKLLGIKAPLKSQDVAPGPDSTRPGRTALRPAKTSKTAAPSNARARKIRNYNVED